MTEYEKVHILTDAIFKNVLDNFNPGLKQLISTGRALQKALHHVTTQTKAYVECIYSLAESAQVCKGATSDIGGALLQIAEVHKEINTQVIDNIKSFHSDLLIPLETKQEKEFKHLQLIHKKYSAGHKFHQTAYEKAQNALRKHKKKAKAKYGFDQKELQYAREVKESYQKLEDYQMQNLRLALLEERKRYCFLLDRICAMVRNYASHHSKAHELFTHRLSEWSELCKSPHILPQSSESIINAFKNQDDLYTRADDIQGIDHQSGLECDKQGADSGHGEDSNSYTYGTTSIHRSLDGDNGITATCHSVSNGVLPTQPDFSVSALPQDTQSHARALYTHSGVGETQLSFVTGDIITLIGEARGGWQYGENTRTSRLGWFPVSFTEPIQVDSNRQTEDFRLTTQRVKSLGNLADLHELGQDYHFSGLHSSGHSDSDSGNVHMREHRSASHPERPMSLHAGMMPPSLQLPSKLRLGLPRNHNLSDRHSPRGSFGKRHLFHPKQPSIPENDIDLTSRSSQPSFTYGLYHDFMPVSRQRHTLAYATSPISDIYMGRRHSTIEQLTQQLRANSLLPGTRLSNHINEAPVGPMPSLIRPDNDEPSAFTKVQETAFIPPPEEFRDAESVEERSELNRSQITDPLAEQRSEVISSMTYPSPECSLPLPPPPLPPPNDPPPCSVNCYPTVQYQTLPTGHLSLAHQVSSPARIRYHSSANQPKTGQDPSRLNHVYVQSSVESSPLRQSPIYCTTKGMASHGRPFNPDYVSRPEASYGQTAPSAAAYASSAPSPANSSSGYSSSTAHPGTAPSYVVRTAVVGYDPAPPTAWTSSTTTPPPPPPATVPPSPNPGTSVPAAQTAGTDGRSQAASTYAVCRHPQQAVFTQAHYF